MSAYTAQGALRVDASFDGAQAITKSDTTVLSGVRALYVGTTGNVQVVTAENWARNLRDGDAIVPVLFTAVPAGAILPIGVAQVMATNTTASTIVGLGVPPNSTFE